MAFSADYGILSGISAEGMLFHLHAYVGNAGILCREKLPLGGGRNFQPVASRS